MTAITILGHATPHADAIIKRMKADRMPGLSLSLRVRDYNRETVNALGAALEHSGRGERPLHCPGILPRWEGIYQPVPLVLTPIPETFKAIKVKGRGKRGISYAKRFPVVCPSRHAQGLSQHIYDAKRQDLDNSDAMSAVRERLGEDASLDGFSVGSERSLNAIGAGQPID